MYSTWHATIKKEKLKAVNKPPPSKEDKALTETC